MIFNDSYVSNLVRTSRNVVLTCLDTDIKKSMASHSAFLMVNSRRPKCVGSLLQTCRLDVTNFGSNTCNEVSYSNSSVLNKHVMNHCNVGLAQIQ